MTKKKKKKNAKVTPKTVFFAENFLHPPGGMSHLSLRLLLHLRQIHAHRLHYRVFGPEGTWESFSRPSTWVWIWFCVFLLIGTTNGKEKARMWLSRGFSCVNFRCFFVGSFGIVLFCGVCLSFFVGLIFYTLFVILFILILTLLEVSLYLFILLFFILMNKRWICSFTEYILFVPLMLSFTDFILGIGEYKSAYLISL